MNAQTCNCKNIVFFLLRVEFELLYGLGAPDFDLLAQREVHVDLSHHFHRLAVEQSRLVHPLLHRFE